ncbi:Gfo/Idh/MocA family oxidoreductase [Allorhizobium sp. BGMRC 0089]|uniref:Gfo/Idh/MocA family protein n=1 Tax=Allorhizobium sonneratiae TaxID=2934936 RepID=UPI002033E5CB|nr:Gfo/Idh/MocA family oxidoreductase [Allorhizobium sonneratiae]MCM2293199.1 Gfo/Idh/MocA family oxidoreductase [Allorhizobium sonneratiae]
MKTLGVGLIGSGYMGKCHALAWNNVAAIFGDVPRPRLVALAEASLDLARQRAEEFGFDQATDDWKSLIADPDIDIISITTPNAFHAEMAIAALQAGKHVWCEKPMAPRLESASAMRDAARTAAQTARCIAAIGYNYIQNPVFRQIKSLIESGGIGTITHVRVEMDEDFMADADQAFYWKSESASGYGALDDFAVHPLSLLYTLFGPLASVACDMVKPYAERPLASGGRRAVENHDIASMLCRFDSGLSATVCVNRSAWGRKGRIAVQIYGSKGSILYDQERMNEFQLYLADDPAALSGFRTILTGPQHPPYGRFIPAPGHGLGFNDLKTIECREILVAIAGKPAHLIDFETGYRVEMAIHAMAKAHTERRWVDLSEFE